MLYITLFLLSCTEILLIIYDYDLKYICFSYLYSIHKINNIFFYILCMMYTYVLYQHK